MYEPGDLARIQEGVDGFSELLGKLVRIKGIDFYEARRYGGPKELRYRYIVTLLENTTFNALMGFDIYCEEKVLEPFIGSENKLYKSLLKR